MKKEMHTVIKYLSTTEKLILEDGTEITIRLKKNKTSDFSVMIRRVEPIHKIEVKKYYSEEEE